jgi:hypothetical protein
MSKTIADFNNWFTSKSAHDQDLLLGGRGYKPQELVNEVVAYLPALYDAEGVRVTTARGTRHKTMVAYWHDGVQYTMDDHGKLDVRHSTSHLKLVIARHHSVVKEVYDYCTSLGVGDIWAMTGGGCQLQVFFGNSTGYLAILYLDMDETPMGKVYTKKADVPQPRKVWTLQVQSNKNDPLFANMNIPGVKVRTCFEVYGAD